MYNILIYMCVYVGVMYNNVLLTRSNLWTTNVKMETCEDIRYRYFVASSFLYYNLKKISRYNNINIDGADTNQNTSQESYNQQGYLNSVYNI